MSAPLVLILSLLCCPERARFGRVAALWLTVGLFIRAPLSASAGDGSLVLDIGGSAGVAFSGACDVVTEDGTKHLDLHGVAPQRFELAGAGLSCELRKDSRHGTLVVVARRGQSVSQSAMTGANARISFSLQ